ncbi:hypothetical protein LCGC14_2348830, partial [marine sediment metagenome]
MTTEATIRATARTLDLNGAVDALSMIATEAAINAALKRADMAGTGDMKTSCLLLVKTSGIRSQGEFAALVIKTSSAPSPLIVPAKTSSPGALNTGTLSPVIGAWFISLSPVTTRPSSGILSPERTMICAPTGTSPAGTSRSEPSSSLMRAVGGASSMRAATARRARPRLHASSAR